MKLKQLEQVSPPPRLHRRRLRLLKWWLTFVSSQLQVEHADVKASCEQAKQKLTEVSVCVHPNTRTAGLKNRTGPGLTHLSHQAVERSEQLEQDLKSLQEEEEQADSR